VFSLKCVTLCATVFVFLLYYGQLLVLLALWSCSHCQFTVSLSLIVNCWSNKMTMNWWWWWWWWCTTGHGPDSSWVGLATISLHVLVPTGVYCWVQLWFDFNSTAVRRAFDYRRSLRSHVTVTRCNSPHTGRLTRWLQLRFDSAMTIWRHLLGQ